MAKIAYKVIEITDLDEAMGIQGLPFAVKIRDPGFPELTLFGFPSRAEAERWIAIQKQGKDV